MPTVVSLINLKGGVGKTTTTVQLAECLASQFGKRVLVIDLDPQTNATISLIEETRWEELDTLGHTLFHLFNDKLEGRDSFVPETAIQSGVSNLQLRGLDLLASSIRFIDIQDRIGTIPEKVHHTTSPMEVLKHGVHDLLPRYDFVLIDCPPNLGYITQNGIEISDYYLIPTIPDTLSTYGIPQIVKSIRKLSQARKLRIRPLGLVITKYDSRSPAHARGMQALPARFAEILRAEGLAPAPVFAAHIPQASATTDAMNLDLAGDTFKAKYGRSRVGDRYLYQYVIDLTREFLGHVGG